MGKISKLYARIKILGDEYRAIPDSQNDLREKLSDEIGLVREQIFALSRERAYRNGAAWGIFVTICGLIGLIFGSINIVIFFFFR